MLWIFFTTKCVFIVHVSTYDDQCLPTAKFPVGFEVSETNVTPVKSTLAVCDIVESTAVNSFFATGSHGTLFVKFTL